MLSIELGDMVFGLRGGCHCVCMSLGGVHRGAFRIRFLIAIFKFVSEEQNMWKSCRDCNLSLPEGGVNKFRNFKFGQVLQRKC